MIKEFIDFAQELFPSISPYTAEQAKNAITQFQKSGQSVEYLTSVPLEYICQGDIFDNVPFQIYNDDGNLAYGKLHAQVLTNTCDCERNKYLTFAALHPISDFPSGRITDIRKNITYQFIYLPDKRTEDYIIDLSLLTTIPRILFNKAVDMK